MSDENIGHRALAKVSLGVLEATIADALGEIAGRRYSVSISRLDMQPTSNADLTDEYEIVVRVRRDVDSSLPLTKAAPEQAEGSAPDPSVAQPPATEVAPDNTVTGLTGRQLNHEWQVGARHALYHHEGHWYHQLRRFPGALFDYNGYVVFETMADFSRSSELNIRQDVHVPKGIASMPGYIRRR